MTKPSLFIRTLFIAMVFLAQTAVAAEQSRTALVIGNSQYSKGMLKNPVNDAKAIARQLEALEFEVILSLDADQQSMDAAINDFGRQLEKKKGVGLFFYAGHGMQSNGANFLIPVNATLDRETDLKYQAVNFNKVLDEMKFAGNGINIAILDACRDNPLSRSWSRSGQRGLARTDSNNNGTLIVYSTSPGETAADGDGNHSPFAQALLANLPKPDLHLTELFNDVGLEVQKNTRKKQTPWMSSSPLPKIFLASGSIQPNPKPTPNPVAAKGDLSISTQPAGATLYLEGGWLGQSPQTVKGLTAEQGYSVEARLNGYETTRERVTIKAGKQHKITLQLDQAGTHLTVNTRPSQARVRILNITPPYEPGMKLEAGSYRIEVSARGYETVDKWIQVSGGNHIETVELEQPRQNSVVSSLGLEFVDIPAGHFAMGSKEGEGDSDEHPVRRVDVPAFKMMTTEVTKGQFAQFVGATGHSGKGCYYYKEEWIKDENKSWQDPGYPQEDNHPVACVSYDDAMAFAQWLSKETGLHYRLPSEAEWEYAARARSNDKYSFGNDENKMCQYGNGADLTKSPTGQSWNDKANCHDGYWNTAPVGRFKANGFGLYDMHGNLWEWTQDCYHDSYKGAPKDGSARESVDCAKRVLRGGSWYYIPAGLRSADRGRYSASNRIGNSGFRLVQGR